MSGAGRKTSYRKGVTKKVLYGDPEPKENEQVVRVLALRGSNLFEVQHADGTTSLTMLPQKFRKLIWVKRGDYLIVSSGDETPAVDGKKNAVTSIVEHILYKDQIKNLRNKNLWPLEFDTLDASQEAGGEETTRNDEENEEPHDEEALAENTASQLSITSESSKGITTLPMYSDDFFLNRNRRKGVFEDDEEEDDESDEE